MDCPTRETRHTDLVSYLIVIDQIFLLKILDSIESATREINILFPDFDKDKWYKQEEALFREQKLKFLEANYIHVINENLLK